MVIIFGEGMSRYLYFTYITKPFFVSKSRNLTMFPPLTNSPALVHPCTHTSPPPNPILGSCSTFIWLVFIVFLHLYKLYSTLFNVGCFKCALQIKLGLIWFERLGELMLEPANLQFPESNTHSALVAINDQRARHGPDNCNGLCPDNCNHWVLKCTLGTVGSSIPAYLQLLLKVE